MIDVVSVVLRRSMQQMERAAMIHVVESNCSLCHSDVSVLLPLLLLVVVVVALQFDDDRTVDYTIVMHHRTIVTRIVKVTRSNQFQFEHKSG